MPGSETALRNSALRWRTIAFRLMLVVTLPVLGCGYGMAAYYNKWFPYHLARIIKVRLGAPTPEPQPTNVAGLISIHSAEDALELRRKLCEFLWGRPESPHDFLPSQITAVDDPRCKDLGSLVQRIDELLFEMEFGLQSRVYYFVPRKPNGRLVLVHAGHSQDFSADKSHIRLLLDRGYTVAALCMPLQGLNNQPVVDLPRVGRIKLSSHDQMKLLQPEAGYPIKYFIEPVIGVLNHVQQFHFHQISMIGLSGGGWTTILAAAVDPRIQISCPVSGGYPLFLRVQRDDWGDWEQNATDLYRTATYLEMFTLGAFGTGRLQLQVVNRYDSDCFGGDAWRIYAQPLRGRITSLQSGQWNLFVDDSHLEHIVSQVAMAKFLEALNDGPTLTHD